MSSRHAETLPGVYRRFPSREAPGSGLRGIRTHMHVSSESVSTRSTPTSRFANTTGSLTHLYFFLAPSLQAKESINASPILSLNLRNTQPKTRQSVRVKKESLCGGTSAAKSALLYSCMMDRACRCGRPRLAAHTVGTRHVKRTPENACSRPSGSS